MLCGVYFVAGYPMYLFIIDSGQIPQCSIFLETGNDKIFSLLVKVPQLEPNKYARCQYARKLSWIW